ncbi:DUF29 domain-containing protein [Geminocystis sp. GBBB08]|uniref:DUF29 domain-containing protein n=1 Tax=Geminocystis sp. GBBB08 TaxID=2604140 RepID=UPI0027E2B984|nr:DUF29 domain-containing protein [Geminocystis sp. GBBB08]MBL1210351.1 DUF29 domain-containing protein [Geminocystis sp. GBBB08]
MIVDTQEKLKELYEIDDYLWLEETVKLLKEKQFHQLDLPNLIEELEDLGSEKRHKIESLLEQIIRHLLLLQYSHEEREQNYRHWESEVISFRTQINRRMTTNFAHYLETNLNSIYQDSRKYVLKKSGLNTFPLECPYTLDQLLDEDWFPEI